METSEVKSSSNSLKSRLSGRAVLLVIGGILLFGAFAVARSTQSAGGVQMSAVPQPGGSEAGAGAVPAEPPAVAGPGGHTQVQAVPQPAGASAGAAAQTIVVAGSDSFPREDLFLPVIALGILGLLAYGIYDLLRMYLRYRISKERDDVMFP